MTDSGWPSGVRELVESLWHDIEVSAQRKRIDAAKADPQSHKLSTDFPDGLRWLYVRAGKDGLKREVRFCYSTTRNAAGYFLGWREVRSAKGGKRTHWTASKTRRVVRDRAIQRAQAWRQHQRDDVVKEQA